jgi:hypothetical protein
VNKRDKKIVEDLIRFRVLDRDQIIKLHFKTQKDPINSCNKVLKRLVLQNEITVDRSTQPYRYFPIPHIKKDSLKIPHFKAIADFYINLCNYKKPTLFEVEYKTGEKGSIEPDIYMVWNGAPFFVEIQRVIYSKKVLYRKMKLYQDYFYSGDWKKESKYFPYIWMITDHVYKLNFEPLKVMQSKDVKEFMKKYIRQR